MADFSDAIKLLVVAMLIMLGVFVCSFALKLLELYVAAIISIVVLVVAIVALAKFGGGLGGKTL